MIGFSAFRQARMAQKEAARQAKIAETNFLESQNMKRSPREILELYKKYNDPYNHQCIKMFGRTGEEILRAIEFEDQYGLFHKQTKSAMTMTREQAVKILQNKCFGITITGQAGRWIEALEALGILKFEEPAKKDTYIFFPNPDAGKDNVGVKFNDAAKTLEEYGFKLVRMSSEERFNAEKK